MGIENVNTSDIKSNRQSLQDKKKMKVDTKAKKGGDVGTSTTDEVLRKTKEDLGTKRRAAKETYDQARMWATRAEIAETEMEKKKREMENAKNEYEKTRRVVEEKKKVVESLRRCQRIKEREAAYAELAAIEAEERNEMANQAKRAERRT